MSHVQLLTTGMIHVAAGMLSPLAEAINAPKGVATRGHRGRPSMLCCMRLQVFPQSEFHTMFSAFKKSIAAGGPAYHLAEYTVLDNPYQAVHGGWKVRKQTCFPCQWLDTSHCRPQRAL